MFYPSRKISCFDSYRNRRVNFLLPQWGGGGKMCAGGVHSGGHLKYYINWWENCQGAHGHSYFRISRFSRFWGPFSPPWRTPPGISRCFFAKILQFSCKFGLIRPYEGQHTYTPSISQPILCSYSVRFTPQHDLQYGLADDPRAVLICPPEHNRPP